MAFSSYTSHKINILIKKKLCPLLMEGSKDPFKEQTIIVQNQGMATYLKQQIARETGIASNLSFPFLNHFIDEIVNLKNSEETERFLPGPLCWQIFQWLEENYTEYNDLNNYIQHDNRQLQQLKQYQLAEQIATVFDLYQIYRPDIILNWETNEKPDQSWQTAIWRSVTANHTSRSRLFQTVIKNEAFSPDFDQVFVFGIFAMPPLLYHFLQKLGQQADVHFFYFLPAKNNWAMPAKKQLVQEFPIYTTPQFSGKYLNPLLETHGKMGQEFYSILSADTQPEFIDIGSDKHKKESLLEQIQQDIRLNLPVRKHILPQNDTSVTITSCHSKLREIEILHNQLLQYFRDEENLVPGDIIIMTPDIITYVPFIHAVFDQFKEKDAQYIPYSVSDNPANYGSRIVNGFLKLLQPAMQRFKVTDVLEILEIPAVFQNFGISDTDLLLIKKWFSDTNIRWGIDAKHRESLLGVTDFREFSFKNGIQRMLLGYALNDEGHSIYNNICPYDNIEGSSGILLGKVLTFIKTLEHLLNELSTEHTVTEWIDVITEFIYKFFDQTDEFQREINILNQALMSLQNDIKHTTLVNPLSVTIIRHYLEKTLSNKLHERGFFRGKVTFCTMQPMRNIPSKVICLLGMNEGEFPRRDKRLSFNLIDTTSRIGDRTRADEDRYLFLEALLSAENYFYISYLGQHRQSNDEIPPAISVSELIDYITSIYGEDYLKNIFHKHPLHGFHYSYFTDNQHFFSFSNSNFSAASTLYKKDSEETVKEIQTHRINNKPLTKSIELSELIRFYKNPSKYFITNVLNTELSVYSDEILSDMDFLEANGLDKYKIDQEILNGLCAGESKEKVYNLLKSQDSLPVKSFGNILFSRRFHEIEAILNSNYDELGNSLLGFLTQAEKMSVNLNLGDYQINSTLENIKNKKQLYIRVAKEKPSDKIIAWLQHLIISSSDTEDTETYSFTGNTPGDKLFKLPVIESAQAKKYLKEIIKYYNIGCRKPLPFFPESACEYATLLTKKASPATREEHLNAARNKWLYSYYGKEESSDLYFSQFFKTDFFDHPSDDLNQFIAISQLLFFPFTNFGNISASKVK